MKFSELQIRLHCDNNGSWADFYSRLPGKDAERLLAKNISIDLDLEKLEDVVAGCDPQEYSTTFSDMFYAQNEVKNILRQVILEADALRLTVRIRIRTNHPKLQNVRWELLRHPDHEVSLFSSGERFLLSRYLDSSECLEGPCAKSKLKILGAIANPANLPGSLPIINSEDEIATVKNNIGNIHFELAGTASIDNIISELQNKKHDILYLVCHGLYGDDKKPYLWLENANKTIARIEASEFSNKIKELSHRPRLVILLSCNSAGNGAMGSNALAALGPSLLAAGVPMVLGMQGNISFSTAHTFIGKFLQYLRRSNHVDWSVSAARSSIRTLPDFWVPVLYMRSDDGKLWDISPDDSQEEYELRDLLEEHFGGGQFRSLPNLSAIPFDAIREAYRATMNDAKIELDEPTNTLMDIVLQLSEQLSSSKLLFSFLERLVIVADKFEPGMAKALAEWSEHHCDTFHLGVADIQNIRKAIAVATKIDGPPCLQIIISPDFTNPNQPKYLIDARDGLKNNRILDRIYRTKFDPEEFSQIFLASLGSLLEDWQSLGPTVTNWKATNQTTNLWVEIFAPLQFLNELIDQWHVKNDFDEFVIGHCFIVVLRSYDRYYGKNKWSLWPQWKDNWDYFVNFQNQVERTFFDEIDQTSAEFTKISASRIICLGIGCKPLSNRIEILKQALKSGVPYILWTRSEISPDYREQVCDLVQSADMDNIPIRLRDLRKADDEVGKSLGIIWDDGRRTPPQLEPFKSPG